MKKRIVICADGTWNRPEKNLNQDFPTKEFRSRHSYKSREVKFVGVWDTVDAMGIPISFLGLFDDKDEFYDTKIGKNVRIARHAR